MKKKLNKLKILLILNDFYKILCYIRQPLLKVGNKTAQQITTFPIFLSFFVISLGILQISFDTRSFSIFKNYPLLLTFINQIYETPTNRAEKIDQKFETLYLQFLETGACVPEENIQKFQQKLQQTKNLTEEEKRFIEYYRKLEAKRSFYPIIFKQIHNEKQRQDIINLYKTFEQLAPILVSEILKEESNLKKEETEAQTLAEPSTPSSELRIHLAVDMPYKNWSSNTKNYNEEEDQLLTSWKFPDSDIIIKDLKEDNEKNFDKAYNLVKQFLRQYKTFLENYKFNTKLVAEHVSLAEQPRLAEQSLRFALLHQAPSSSIKLHQAPSSSAKRQVEIPIHPLKKIFAKLQHLEVYPSGHPFGPETPKQYRTELLKLCFSLMDPLIQEIDLNRQKSAAGEVHQQPLTACRPAAGATSNPSGPRFARAQASHRDLENGDAFSHKLKKRIKLLSGSEAAAAIKNKKSEKVNKKRIKTSILREAALVRGIFNQNQNLHQQQNQN